MKETDKNRWMKGIVKFCLIYCAVFPVIVFVAKFFEVDAVDILALVFGLFGGELLLTLVIKIIGDKDKKKYKGENCNG